MGALDRVFRGRRGGQERPLAAIIAGLWSNGEQGVWYDPEGFRDAWNSVGSELTPAVAPVFGEASVVSPGVYRIYSSAGAFSSVGAVASTTAVIGRKYIVSFNVDSITTLGGGLVVESVENPAVTTLGPKSFLVTAANTSLHIKRNSNACDLQISGVSAKEWLGRDSCTLYQDAAGTLPAYMPGQGQVDPPVGLLLDKRLGLTRGPEVLTNGDFSAGATSWTVVGEDATHVAAFADGKVRYQSDTTTPVLSIQQINKMTVGAWYEVTVTVSSWVSGSIKSDSLSGASANLVIASGVGTFKSVGRAVSANFDFKRNSTNVDLTIDSVSVRELYGNHAYQTTTTSRPTLSARYNGFLASEKFNDPYWTWQASFTSQKTNEIADPFGGFDAWKITSTNANAALSRAGITGYKNPVFTLVCKAGTWSPAVLVRNGTTSTNLLQGTITMSDFTGTYGKFSSKDLGGGWKELRIEITSGIMVTDSLIVYLGSTGAVPVGQYLYLYRADIREAGDGANLPEYQRVVDANTYDTAGFPLYLRFDGVDDSLLTADIDFSTVNSAIAVSTIRKLSDASRGIVFELGGTGYSSPGSFNQEIMWFSANVSTSYSGATGNATSTYPCIAPFSAVMSSAWNLSAPLQTFRVNGVLRSTSTVAVGGGMFQKAPLFIGRRNNSSVPFNGRLYGLIVRSGATPDATITRIERYLNSKARAY